MTYEEAMHTKNTLELTSNKYSDMLNKFPRNDIGIIIDAAKDTPEYKQVKQSYDNAFSGLQKVNQFIMKNYKKQYMESRKLRRNLETNP